MSTPESKALVRIGAWFKPRTPARDFEFARGAWLFARYEGRILLEAPIYCLGVELPATVPPTKPPVLLMPVADVDPDRVELMAEVPAGVWTPRELLVTLVFADGTTAQRAVAKFTRGGPASWRTRWPRGRQ
jgi:hypothetical protein